MSLTPQQELTIASTTDDNALRHKVTEAVAVYEEYVKGRDQPESQGVNGSENEKPKNEVDAQA